MTTLHYPPPPPQATTGRTTKRGKTKVLHYFWTDEAILARKLGLPVGYLCGRSSRDPKVPASPRIIPVIGGLMPVSEKRDCKQCVRAFESILRDKWGAGR